ncbi:MAG: transcription-repair coupling factor [Bacteroidales bacterium]|nr:transcription-repair coupling factor [Bacteroidales bacterium]
MILNEIYEKSAIVESLCQQLEQARARVHIDGMTGSMPAVVAAAVATVRPMASHLIVAPSKEDAYYLCNDIEALMTDGGRERVKLFPNSYRRAYHYAEEGTDNANMMMRAEVVSSLAAGEKLVVVSYPDALGEMVADKRTLKAATVHVSRGEHRDMWQLVEQLQQIGFEREDFVVEPGQYAVRGGIVDVYSYASEQPLRIEFFDDEVDSIRTYDAATQLSTGQLTQADIVANLKGVETTSEGGKVGSGRVPIVEYFDADDIVWSASLMLTLQRLDALVEAAGKDYQQRLDDKAHPILGTLPKPEELFCTANRWLRRMLEMKVVEYGNSHYFNYDRSGEDNRRVATTATHSEPQPVFNKRFDLLAENLGLRADEGYRIFITVGNESQRHRLEKTLPGAKMELLDVKISHGFVDHDEKVVIYTDHEIFERYHKYTVRNLAAAHEAMTLKELFELKPGDYVTHIDYGVGRFSGLEKVTRDGKSQELIRLVYKNNDVLYISIHGLHKISRYVGREGEQPQLNRLGSNTWQALKVKTKRQVKDIAKDLIALYAKRKASRGYAFSADGAMQEQLEASFAYEDTPDQLKATVAVKRDMEGSAPMDRLVCGDVGFGKTEVAIRAAFKACCDSKQVAVLVPSTVLAFQHYNTFSERLHDMPVRIDYLNRFRTAKEKRQIYADVASGKIDILIGTHAITNKELKFKDLGLLIVDEEQKFGVGVKERLKQMRTGVDCLTLTATPIPRTLQFSLMGARDLSVIQTPPPNRQPIETELSEFSEELIRDAIGFEMSRGGQTFFISNRVENLPEMAGLVQRLVPDATVAIAHGRMEGKDAESTLMRFLEGEIDVLVATSIVENGLDIPNANTMIINNAHQFGLSDLHQMRGRVGRSNRKAFCYMLVPSHLSLTDDAQRRLRAIEEFSTIGSGFNIAMRDLDIRGAGNILGAEQSGFISEVGYDMYHKILNEAIEELKATDFRELFAAEAEENQEYTRDCTIETDLEVLIPDDYVTSVSERLLLYKELNGLGSEEELAAYRTRLADRFGPIPAATEELIRTITLRRMAKSFGIEKLILKQGRMVCHFVANQQSPFYQSEAFGKMIAYVQANPRSAALKETAERLSLSIANVESIDAALEQMQRLSA